MKTFQLATIVNDNVTPFGPLMARDLAESKRTTLARMTSHAVCVINAATFNGGV